MSRNFKMLGPLLLAALAISTLIAPAPADAKGVLTAGDTDAFNPHTATLVNGVQYGSENYFEVAGNKVSCENSGVAFTAADADGTATSLTLEAQYKDCTTSSVPAATIAMNGCDYLLGQPASAGPPGEFTGKVDLVCPEGKVVEITAYLFGTPTSHNTKVCTIKILPGKGLAHVRYSNGVNEATKKDDLTVEADVRGLSYEQSGTCGVKSGSDAKYKSTITLTGKDAEGNPHDLWMSEE
jgi:hypothetical protein